MEAIYAQNAARVLFKHRHEHPELMEWTGLYRCEDGREAVDWDSIKITVLAELGRLIWKYSNGEEVAVKWSVDVLNMKPKPSVKEAMRIIRGWRLNKYPDGSADALAREIYKTVDSYIESHPSITKEQINDALGQTFSVFYED
jgi:hypothetical protein